MLEAIVSNWLVEATNTADDQQESANDRRK